MNAIETLRLSKRFPGGYGVHELDPAGIQELRALLRQLTAEHGITIFLSRKRTRSTSGSRPPVLR